MGAVELLALAVFVIEIGRTRSFRHALGHAAAAWLGLYAALLAAIAAGALMPGIADATRIAVGVCALIAGALAFLLVAANLPPRARRAPIGRRVEPTFDQ